MIKYIKMFFAFLLPIVRKAALQAAADELNRAVDPRQNRSYSRRPMAGYTKYDRMRPRTMEDVDRLEDERLTRMGVRDAFDNQPFHDVLLVAFDLKGPDASIVHEWLHNQMPRTGNHMARGHNDETVAVNLDSWWVANDERFMHSDCDSAVFVAKGNQEQARRVLRVRGLTA